MEHEKTGPVPKNTVRVSVRFAGDVHVSHFSIEDMMDAVERFEDFAGDAVWLCWDKSVEGTRGIATFAVQEGLTDLLGSIAMWVFLNRPDYETYEHPEDLLKARIEKDGSAWLVASTDDGSKWLFTLLHADDIGAPIIYEISTTVH